MSTFPGDEKLFLERQPAPEYGQFDPGVDGSCSPDSRRAGPENCRTASLSRLRNRTPRCETPEPVTAQGRSRPAKSLLYRRFVRSYDWLFVRLLASHLHQAIRSVGIAEGAKVLEIGVGTGISLDGYPPSANVVGVDISPQMLDRAAQKIQNHRWKHIVLERMDGLNLQFPDESFDFVAAFHVASVVPDATGLVREMHRVCKRDGKIVIVNHLRSQTAWLASLIDLLNPLTQQLGWRTDLRREELLAAAPLEVKQFSKVSPASLFSVLVAQKTN